VNQDGSRDTSYNLGTGFVGAVFGLYEDPSNSKLYVVGNFTTFTGTSVNRIVRLNSDGSRDTTFSGGTGFNLTANVIVPDNNGKLLVGGQFTSYNGTAINRLIRLNTDGSIDTTFSGITSGVTAGGVSIGVNQIAVDTNDKILIGGQFTGYNGTVVGNFARLNNDGSLDTTFSSGTAFNSFTYGGIKVLSGNKYLVAGDFTQYNGVSINRGVALINNNGTRDTGYVPSSISNAVLNTALDSQNRLYLFGAFATLSGVTVNGIGRLTSGGTYDNTFVVGTGLLPQAGQPRLLGPLVENSGNIIYGGEFTTYSGQTVNRILRVNTSGNSLRS
jgi:uncharacterized delta-60 repeat protein